MGNGFLWLKSDFHWLPLLFSIFQQFQSVLRVLLFVLCWHFPFCVFFYISDPSLVPKSAYQNSPSDPCHHCKSKFTSLLGAQAFLWQHASAASDHIKNPLEDRKENPQQQETSISNMLLQVPLPNPVSRYDYSAGMYYEFLMELLEWQIISAVWMRKY